MSKNITIAEGGQAKTFTNVSHLKTNLIGGGTQYWVPEDEAGEYANVDEITITENGTYSARDEDLDGFSTVRVNVSGGGGDEPVLVTKNITSNGTYNASSDGADGYSSVTVNVESTHGRTLISGLNSAPASQRISVRDFLDDLDEQTYAAGMSYFTSESERAFIQTQIREGRWYKNKLNIPEIENYNLVMVGAGGVTSYYSSRKQITIWAGVLGIIDDSGIITLSDMTINRFNALLDDGSKFTNHYGYIMYSGTQGSSTYGSADFIDVKNDIINHNVGPSGARNITIGTNYSGVIDASLPHTPILTNLTGGTIA